MTLKNYFLPLSTKTLPKHPNGIFEKALKFKI
jgi:hypothetical protein